MFESGENYLETILLLEKEKENVRSVDIAKKLNYSKPSVSRAMKQLKEAGYIEIHGSGEIHFTKIGLDTANSIYERHRLLTDFLMQITGVDYSIAESDACKIEHIISEEVIKGIKQYMNR